VRSLDGPADGRAPTLGATWLEIEAFAERIGPILENRILAPRLDAAEALAADLQKVELLGSVAIEVAHT
jgi:hypothetical protein